VKLHALRLPFPFKVMDRGGWCGSPARRCMEVADRGVLLGLTDDHMAHRGGGQPRGTYGCEAVSVTKEQGMARVWASPKGKRRKKWAGPKETMSFLNYSNIFQLT
jgi:hypothetical protein